MYRVSLSPIQCILKDPYKKLKIRKFSIELGVLSEGTPEDLNKGFQELLGGKVLISMKDPLLPVFQVLEGLFILDLVVLESLELKIIAKTLGNMVKNYKSDIIELDLKMDNGVRYVYAIGET